MGCALLLGRHLFLSVFQLVLQLQHILVQESASIGRLRVDMSQRPGRLRKEDERDDEGRASIEQSA